MAEYRWRRWLAAREERWERLIAFAAVVGVASGLSAVALRSAVHFLSSTTEGLRSGWIGIALPAAGAAAGVALMKFVFREKPGHGVPDVIRAVCMGGGRMPRRAMFSRWLGSLINVSSGGSAGLEGPIVYSAAGVGAAVVRFFRLDERRRSIMVACGVAGGISGIFNAPMTGMIFAMEVVLAEYSAVSIVLVVISAATATEISRLVLGDRRSFLYASFEMGTWDLALCVGLGLLGGLISVLLVHTVSYFHQLAERISHRPLLAPATFGIVVGLVGVAFPGAIGEGYETAQLAIHGKMAESAALVAALLTAKILTSSLTLGSGAPGGIFAPSLVVGSLLGTFYWSGASWLLEGLIPIAPAGSYALVGMSALVAGVMQAPLTGMLLVLEVTGGYVLILPLMIVAVLSLVVARHFDHHSIYTAELAARGELLRPGTDRRILADLSVAEAIDRNATPIPNGTNLLELSHLILSSGRNHFPVLRDGRYLGMVSLKAVGELMLDPDVAQVTLVETVMDRSLPTVAVDASLVNAMDTFEDAGAWVLPVVKNDQFVGLLSKSTLFDVYRRELSVQVAD